MTSYGMMRGMATPAGGRLAIAFRATYSEAGLSQEGLAEAIGVDQTTVSAWARGSNRAPLDVLPKVEKVCKVPKGTILRRAGYVEDINGDVLNILKSYPGLRADDRKTLIDMFQWALSRADSTAPAK